MCRYFQQIFSWPSVFMSFAPMDSTACGLNPAHGDADWTV